MVRHQFFVGCLISLKLLHGVVEEKVDEDGVDFCVGMLSGDFPPDEFNNPYAAPYNLKFGQKIKLFFAE